MAGDFGKYILRAIKSPLYIAKVLPKERGSVLYMARSGGSRQWVSLVTNHDSPLNLTGRRILTPLGKRIDDMSMISTGSIYMSKKCVYFDI